MMHQQVLHHMSGQMTSLNGQFVAKRIRTVNDSGKHIEFNFYCEKKKKENKYNYKISK